MTTKIKKDEWYPIRDRQHNLTLNPRYIDGKIFTVDKTFTSKAKAEARANKTRKWGLHARVVPLSLWGRLRGQYQDDIGNKYYKVSDNPLTRKQCYVVFHHLPEKQEDYL